VDISLRNKQTDSNHLPIEKSLRLYSSSETHGGVIKVTWSLTFLLSFIVGLFMIACKNSRLSCIGSAVAFKL
jgi:hypothetical protein